MQAAQTTEAPPSKVSQRNAWLALVLLVPVPSIGTAAALWWWPDLAIGKILFVATKLWILALPLAWLLLVERSRPGWSPPRHGGFGVAIGTGLAIAAIILGAYALVRKLNLLDATIITERAALTGLDQPAFYIGGALYWILFNSLMEEYVWRWFVFRQAEAVVGGRAAVLFSASGFTAHHVVALAAQFNWPITALASLGVFIGGVTWSWLYLRFRSIWPCYVSHAIVDAPIFLIGWWLIFRGGA